MVSLKNILKLSATLVLAVSAVPVQAEEAESAAMKKGEGFYEKMKLKEAAEDRKSTRLNSSH